MPAYRTNFLGPDNRPNPKTTRFCARCNKDLKPGSASRWIFIFEGGMTVLHPDEVSRFDPEGQDVQGWFEIGPECVRRIGIEWTVAENPEVPA